MCEGKSANGTLESSLGRCFPLSCKLSMPRRLTSWRVYSSADHESNIRSTISEIRPLHSYFASRMQEIFGFENGKGAMMISPVLL